MYPYIGAITNHSVPLQVIHDCDMPISVKEWSAECEKSPFFKDIYKHIAKGHIPPQIKGHALRKLKIECIDYLVIDDVLIPKIPTDKKHRTFIIFGHTRNLCSYNPISLS